MDCTTRRVRPNVLTVMADQMAAGALPAYGNRVALTQHMGTTQHRCYQPQSKRDA